MYLYSSQPRHLGDLARIVVETRVPRAIPHQHRRGHLGVDGEDGQGVCFERRRLP